MIGPVRSGRRPSSRARSFEELAPNVIRFTMFFYRLTQPQDGRYSRFIMRETHDGRGFAKGSKEATCRSRREGWRHWRRSRTRSV